MKAIIPILAVTTLCVFGTNQVLGQSGDQGLPVAPAHPEGEEDPFAADQKKLDEVQNESALAAQSKGELEKRELDMQKRRAEKEYRTAALAEAAAQKRYIAQNRYRRASGGLSKSLVISTSAIEPKDLAKLEEDLAIMTHIIDKSLKANLGAGVDRKALGIDVFFVPGGSPIRSLYLEGYGALFLVNVNWPLLAPADDSESNREIAPADSTWDEAKSELFGQPREGKGTGSPGEPFSEEKLNNLKRTLLEALKNVANIHELKPDDAVTVCVSGSPVGSASAPSKTKAKPDEEKAKAWMDEGRAKAAASERATVMTLRVQKADADAYAGGKLSFEQFRQKARITTYAGGLLTTGGPFVWTSADGDFLLRKSVGSQNLAW